MRRLLLFIILITLLPTVHARAQTPAKPVLNPDKLAEDWIDRMKALDDWYLTVDGKESPELALVVNRMMELFAPDVLAEVPPHDEDQIGPIMLLGNGQVRKWVEQIARSQVKLEYILKRQTEKEFEGELLVFSRPLPWGGVGISFQIIGAWSQRQDRRRFMAPGSVFLQLGEDGKIHRLRFYLTETAEVVSI